MTNASYTRARVDLEIYENANFDKDFKWLAGDTPDTTEPVDLTGYTAVMQIKLSKQDETPLMTLSTEDGTIVIPEQTGDNKGKYLFKLTTEETTGICPKHTDIQAVYDMFLTSPAPEEYVRAHQFGNVIFIAATTRE